MEQTCQYLLLPATSSNIGSPNASIPDLEVTGIRASTIRKNQLYVHTSRKIAATDAEYIQIRKLRPDALPDSGFIRCKTHKKLSISLAALQPGLPLWKRMQRPSGSRYHLGIYSDIVTAPQPLGLSGPIVQGHLMTIQIRNVDLILSQAPKIKKPECRPTTIPMRTVPHWEQTRQNSSQSKFPISQACIRNKSQVSGLCGPI